MHCCVVGGEEGRSYLEGIIAKIANGVWSDSFDVPLLSNTPEFITNSDGSVILDAPTDQTNTTYTVSSDWNLADSTDDTTEMVLNSNMSHPEETGQSDQEDDGADVDPP